MLFLLLPVRILPILITMATDWALSISLTWVGISGERAYQIFPTSLQGKDSCPHLTDEETEAQKEAICPGHKAEEASGPGDVVGPEWQQPEGTQMAWQGLVQPPRQAQPWGLGIT